jgi:hypothetical protein
MQNLSCKFNAFSHPAKISPGNVKQKACLQPQGRAEQNGAVQCSAVQCSAVQCSAVQCSAVQCSAVQCSAVVQYQ